MLERPWHMAAQSFERNIDEVKKAMTIAEVSRKFGLSADTLRYYERIGLIPAVPRAKNGIRDYDENSCRWI